MLKLRRAVLFTVIELKLKPEEILKDIHAFYNSREWRKLSKRIRKKQNNECQICKSKGKYKRAVITHHVRELKKYPELAYSETFIDEDGAEQLQLIGVCFDCHEEQHPDRFSKKEKKGFINEELW